MLSDVLKDNLTADYNQSGCKPSGLNHSLIFSNDANHSNHTDQYNIDSALSFFVTGSDLSATVWSQPLYYLSNFIPIYWVKYQNHGKINQSEAYKKIQALFFSGALLIPISLSFTYATVDGLPWLLSLPIFGVQSGALCFFKALSERTLWSLTQFHLKSWLEQFYFSLDLKRYVVVPSVICLVLSCAALIFLPRFNISFFYMSLPALTEAILCLNHMGWFFVIPVLRDLKLWTSIPQCKESVSLFLKILKESFYVILSIIPELLAQFITTFVAASHGGSTPEDTLKAQQNFYFAYLLQASAALCMTIAVGKVYDEPEKVKNKVVMDTIAASSMLCLPAIIATTLLNLCLNAEIHENYPIYALGAGISFFEFLRTQMLAALKVLDCNCKASITVCLILVSTQVVQILYGFYAKKEGDSDSQVAQNILGIQMGGSALAALATTGLYAARRRAKPAQFDEASPTELVEALLTS